MPTIAHAAEPMLKLPALNVADGVKRFARRWPQVYTAMKRTYGAARFALRSPHEPDFAFYAHFNGRRGLFLDIGANCGQSARSFRIFNRSFDILSFEPNKLLEPDLKFTRRLLGAKFNYLLCGLGESKATAELYVPQVGGTPHTPWASLNRAALEDNRQYIEQELGGAFSIAQTTVDIRPLDDFGFSPELAKIDVEGFELSVLLGMRNTLARCSPLLLIECNSSQSAARRLLAELGYRFFEYQRASHGLSEVGPSDSGNFFALQSKHIVELGKHVRCRSSAA